MVARTAVLFAVSSLFIAGCAPSLRIEVPAGWKVQRDLDDGRGMRSLQLVPEAKSVSQGSGAWIMVVCEPAAPNTEFVNVSQSLDDAGARIVDFRADSSAGIYLISFALDDSETGPMRGKVVIKPDSGQHGKTLMLQGLWPAYKDAEFSRVFDAVDASVDFK